MNCIDCIHYEPCKEWAWDCFGEDTEFPYEAKENLCKHYKNKMTSGLPCEIGQPVWKLQTWYRSTAELVEGRVSMIQQKADKSWKIRVSTKYGTDDLKAGDIGEYVFFSENAAKAALIARNTAEQATQ